LEVPPDWKRPAAPRSPSPTERPALFCTACNKSGPALRPPPDRPALTLRDSWIRYFRWRVALAARSVTRVCGLAGGRGAAIFSLPPSRVVSFWRERLGGGRLFQRRPQSPTSGGTFGLGRACPWGACLPWSKYGLDFPSSLSLHRPALLPIRKQVSARSNCPSASLSGSLSVALERFGEGAWPRLWTAR
jgi:hypothetical protein